MSPTFSGKRQKKCGHKDRQGRKVSGWWSWARGQMTSQTVVGGLRWGAQKQKQEYDEARTINRVGKRWGKKKHRILPIMVPRWAEAREGKQDSGWEMGFEGRSVRLWRETKKEGKGVWGSAGCLFVYGTISQLAFTVNAGWKTKKKKNWVPKIWAVGVRDRTWRGGGWREGGDSYL